MKKLNPLNSKDIEELSKEFETLTFPNDCDLVYENQIPLAGIVLIEGELMLIQNSQITERVIESCIIGIVQLVTGSVITYGCRVKANSKIMLIGKSKVLNVIENKSFLGRLIS